MYYLIVIGITLLVGAALAGITDASRGIIGLLFYIGMGIMFLGVGVIIFWVCCIFDESSVSVKPRSRSLRRIVPVTAVLVTLLQGVLVYYYKWNGLLLILNANSDETSMLIFYAQVALCGVVGYPLFLRLMVERGDGSTYKYTEVTKTTYYYGDPVSTYSEETKTSYNKLQFVIFGAIGVIVSAACAFTPVCYVMFAYVTLYVNQVKNKIVKTIVYLIAVAITIACIVCSIKYIVDFRQKR